MNALKKFWNSFLDLLGFKRDTKYVKGYLNDSNMKSGIYMSGIIVVLEIFMVIRQHYKYIFKAVAEGGNYFDELFKYTSLYFLLIFFGIAMFAYCIYYSDKKLTKAKLITLLVFSGIGILSFTMLFFESSIHSYNPETSKYKGTVDYILLLASYLSTLLFHIAVMIGTIFIYKGKRIQWLQSALVISLFALVCLIFGVRVSFGDFFTSKAMKVSIHDDGLPYWDGKDHVKGIMCFLMFSIYIGCLLIWKPYISIGVLGVIFLGFYFLLKSNYDTDPEHIRMMSDGDVVNYVTFFISLAMICISTYNQRKTEARKDEKLELLATVDTLTGLKSFEYFISLCNERHQDKSIEDKYVYIFIDISSFKTFNEKRGFEAGNKFLKDIGEILTKHFPNDLITRQGDDHFVIFAPVEGAENKLLKINEEVGEYDKDIQPGIIAGLDIIIDVSEDPRLTIEKARYAVDGIKHRVGKIYCFYDEEMHKKYELMQYIVHHIDEAVEKGYIKPYYQPVVYSSDQTLCGFEALTRWIDPIHGFMNPGVFIGVLEDSLLVYKIDFHMLELVCQDLRKRMDAMLPVVPVSINFSRVDFLVCDVEKNINEIINKYNIPKQYIHIEITESALNSQGDDLKKSLKYIKEDGLAIWLDDFGSGYSSFNALKDYDFDVLKLDLEFLKGFDRNQKARPLIKSVIDMANQIGMGTLSEGVETKEQAEFLKKIGCMRLQGYLFGKPEPYDVIAEKMLNGFFEIAKDPFK